MFPPMLLSFPTFPHQLFCSGLERVGLQSQADLNVVWMVFQWSVCLLRRKRRVEQLKEKKNLEDASLSQNIISSVHIIWWIFSALQLTDYSTEQYENSVMNIWRNGFLPMVGHLLQMRFFISVKRISNGSRQQAVALFLPSGLTAEFILVIKT